MVLSKNKQVLIYIAKILKKTDEFHPITASAICDVIQKEYAISVERRAVGRSIAILRDSGMDIVFCKDNRLGCYLRTHQFTKAQLKVFLDMVNQEEIFTEDEKIKLFETFIDTTSDDIAKALMSTTYLKRKSKGKKSNTLNNIDCILAAIMDQKQLTFAYGDLDEKLRLVPRYEGLVYKVNPYVLTSIKNIYYLVCSYKDKPDLAYYRLDKMIDVKIHKDNIKSPKEVLGDTWQSQIDDFIKNTVRGYGGSDKTIVVVNANKFMINYLYDEFGQNIIRIERLENDTYDIYIDTADNQGLYFLLLQYGNNLIIKGPDKVREKYISMLKSIISKYE